MVTDAKKALDTWTPDQNKVRRTLTSAHRGRNPLVGRRRPSDVDKDLPEVPSPQPDASLAPPNPVSSLSTPTSQRDRAEYRRTSNGATANQEHYDRQSHRLSAPSTGYDNSPRKPDEIRPSSPWDTQSSSPPSLVPSPSYPPGSYHLTPPDYQQYYQFYEQYTPPQPWEEAAGQLIRSPAVFHPSAHQTETRREAGGFVLPGSVPSEYEHQEMRSPTPTSNPQVSEPASGHQLPSQHQQTEQAKKELAAQHMPGDFPDTAAQEVENKPEKSNATKPVTQPKPEPSKSNTNTGGGAKVSALLAKFQNLSSNK